MQPLGRSEGPGTLVPFHRADPIKRPDEAALQPLRKAYNDKSLTQAKRNELVKDYFYTTVRPGAIVPVTLALLGKGDMPLSRSGGVDGPLVPELRGSPAFQKAFVTAANEIAQQRPIDESWPKLVKQLGVANSLKSLTLIYSFYKWQEAPGLPAAVKDAGHAAYTKTCWINQQRSDDIRKGNTAALAATQLPLTMVMNHGNSDTYDNPTHFFAHAWLAYRLLEQGYSEKQALQTSAFAGGYYEAERPSSLDENHGNASIKDILMNSQGSNFGVQLFHDAHAPLPGPNDGIPAEDRDI